jgi:hypothetical protein
MREAGENLIGLSVFSGRVGWALLDFEPHESLGLVEFHGLWFWVAALWLRWGKYTGGCKPIGGKLASCRADADEWDFVSSFSSSV